ncbi:uncharacterized protein DUF4238 [Haloarcula quadrata]|jgi:hypothetical protein|uniref:Uncharacterized protein DUF4238 n=1 Tax=Haloarcula quadrata TaxID=182779 RepID=A0A495QQC1_9EURY|nr:DUF4238 domain-containing protein [Haloarcula quadrata]RKS75148.1 uncharacterized protein DUF4238 [Haloarcula quadrata]
MPERKNQHYVPKHYLRAWADNERINVFPLSKGESFPDNTSSICSRSYFYGNPPIVEDELQHVDGDHASSVRELRNNNLSDLSPRQIKLLLSFITTQRSRTKATKKDIRAGEDFLRDAIRDDLKHDRYENLITWDPELTPEEREDTMVDASLLGTHHYVIGLGIFGYHVIKDLEAVMLCNLTEQEFVTSDVPIVFDNPRYKPYYGTVAGLSNRGVQIYCPISPDQLLLLYDPQIYNIRSNHKQQTLIKNPDVVNQFNLTQFHNAENTVLFHNSTKDYIQDLHSRIDEVRRRQQITVPMATEEMEMVEVEKTPPYQLPKISPDIPGSNTVESFNYTKERPTSEPWEGRNLVRKMFSEAKSRDIGLIYTIRVFREHLGSTS